MVFNAFLTKCDPVTETLEPDRTPSRTENDSPNLVDDRMLTLAEHSTLSNSDVLDPRVHFPRTERLDASCVISETEKPPPMAADPKAVMRPPVRSFPLDDQCLPIIADPYTDISPPISIEFPTETDLPAVKRSWIEVAPPSSVVLLTVKLLPT